MIDGKYNLIYMDPPWHYAKRNKNTTFGAGASYAKMKLPALKAMLTTPTTPATGEILPPLQDIIDDNCVLFMWSVCPHLDWAIELMKAWGFRYVTKGFTWIKVTDGSKLDDDCRGGNNIRVHTRSGHYTASNSEDILVGIKGRMKPEIKGTLTSQVILHHYPGEHSEKPAIFRELIAKMYPSAKKLELFARHTHPDFDSWGDEVGKLDDP